MQNNINFNTNYQTGNNNVNIGNLPRLTNPNNIDLFIAEMKNNLPKKSEITIKTYFGDSECYNSAFLIKEIFEKAGWTIKSFLQEIPNQPIKNIQIGVPISEKDSMVALIIYNWLNQNNLKPIPSLVENEYGYIIYIGQNL